MEVFFIISPIVRNRHMESLPAEEARDAAQHMLNIIAEMKNNTNKEKVCDG